MVNTRILQQSQHRKGAGGDTDQPVVDIAPRSLRHAPILQGRVGAVRQSGRRGVAVGLNPQRSPGLQAVIADAWAALPLLADDLEEAARRCGRVPAFGRASDIGVALDQLRSQILRVVGDRGWRRLGITAPQRGAGASYIALGLTASIARLEHLHLLLVDLDLAKPALHGHLGLPAAGGLADALRQDLPAIELVHRIGDTLAVMLNDRPVPEAAELLYSPTSLRALQDLDAALHPDLTIFDLPPLLGDGTAQAALAQVDAVLLVADGTSSTARDIADCEALLDGQVPLLGVVLNKSEDGQSHTGRG